MNHFKKKTINEGSKSSGKLIKKSSSDKDIIKSRPPRNPKRDFINKESENGENI